MSDPSHEAPDPSPPTEQDERTPEDPTRFGERPEIEPLDEAPDGRTPSDPNEPTPGSLPPGAPRD